MDPTIAKAIRCRDFDFVGRWVYYQFNIHVIRSDIKQWTRRARQLSPRPRERFGWSEATWRIWFKNRMHESGYLSYGNDAEPDPDEPPERPIFDTIPESPENAEGLPKSKPRLCGACNRVHITSEECGRERPERRTYEEMERWPRKDDGYKLLAAVGFGFDWDSGIP